MAQGIAICHTNLSAESRPPEHKCQRESTEVPVLLRWRRGISRTNWLARLVQSVNSGLSWATLYQRIRWKTPNQPWAWTCTGNHIHTPVHPHVRTQYTTYTHIRCLVKKKIHTSSHTQTSSNTQTLSGCVCLEGLFTCSILSVLQWGCCERRTVEKHSPQHSYWILPMRVCGAVAHMYLKTELILSGYVPVGFLLRPTCVLRTWGVLLFRHTTGFLCFNFQPMNLVRV